MLRLLARVIGVGIETADMLVQEDARPTIITVIPGLVFGIIYWFLAWLIAGRATDSEGASVRKLRHRKQFVGIGLDCLEDPTMTEPSRMWHFRAHERRSAVRCGLHPRHWPRMASRVKCSGNSKLRHD